jgi:hypothetical protein
VPAGSHRADEDVDAGKLGGQFVGQPCVRLDVVGVVVLVGTVGVRQFRQQFADPVTPRLLPASVRMWRVDDLQSGAVSPEHLPHHRLQAGVGDQRDGVPIDRTGEGQTESECPTGRFDDHAVRLEFAAFAGANNHVQGGSVFDAAWIASLQLCPETRSMRHEWLTDMQGGRISDSGRQGRVVRPFR